MADQRKFQKMLELLVNEDRDAAEELFHEIVVEKSRDIYQSLISEETEEDEEVEESDYDDDDDDDENVDEGFDLDEFEVEADDDIGGDETDDLMTDLGMDDGEEGDDMDMDGMDDGDDDVDDRVEDLEDALEDLKAEFDKMMSGDDGDEDDGEEDEDDEDEDGEEDEDPDAAASARKESDYMTDGEQMREYVEKVAPAKHGDNGANAKSTVAGKNDMGGTTQNIARNDTENSVEANKGNLKGSSLSGQNPKEMSTKNVNVPGGKAGKTGYKKSEPGHGAEKKGQPEKADNAATSTLNKVSTRAK